MRFSAYPVLLVAVLLSFPITLFAAHQNIEVIELQHRDTDDVISIIKPLLGKHDSISGSGNQLILKSSPDTLTKIKKIITKIDQPIRRLKITVRYAQQTPQSEDTAQISGNVAISKKHLDNKTITQTKFNARITRTRSDDDNDNTQQLLVSEGRWASFNIGKLMPVTRSKLQVSGVNTTLQTETQYKKTGVGFRVFATITHKSDGALNARRVFLKISPYYAKENTTDNRIIDNISAQTEITGQLGAWINIGGTATTVKRNPRKKTYSTKKQFSDNRRIWVKVELAVN